MNQASGDYVRQFGLSMVAYAVVLVGSILLLEGGLPLYFAVPVALAPVVPVSFGLAALVRFVGQLDELQRRIQLESLGFTAAATAMLTFSYGLLENAGLPEVSLIWVLPLIVFLWGLSTAVVSRRYLA